jgi:hypothetical protein
MPRGELSERNLRLLSCSGQEIHQEASRPLPAGARLVRLVRMKFRRGCARFTALGVPRPIVLARPR